MFRSVLLTNTSVLPTILYKGKSAFQRLQLYKDFFFWDLVKSKEIFFVVVDESIPPSTKTKILRELSKNLKPYFLRSDFTLRLL